MADPDSLTRAALYRVIWRWHGVAGLFVAPFIFFMALTGLPYLWQDELETLAHPDLALCAVPAEETGQRVSWQRQIAAAEAAVPGMKASRVTLWPEPDRATRIGVGAGPEMMSVYVSPWTGEVLGQVRESARLSTRLIAWHGGVPLKDAGSWVIELFACWTVVLCATGLFLWWPRGGRALTGVIIPRLRAGRRIFWRDVHSVTGAWIALFAIGFLATGLPWTAFWGKEVLGRFQQALGHRTPAGSFWNFGLQSGAPSGNADGVSWEKVLQQVGNWPFQGRLEVVAPFSPTGTFRVRNTAERSVTEINAHFDVWTGEEIARATWADKPWTQKAVAFGISFHEGTWWGRVNQWFNTLFALLLMAVAASGAVIWVIRRPSPNSGPVRTTPSSPRRLAWPLPVLAGVAGVVMPFFGISLLLVLGGMWLTGRLRGAA